MKRIVISGSKKEGYTIDGMHAGVVDFRLETDDHHKAQTIGYTIYNLANGFLRIMDYSHED